MIDWLKELEKKISDAKVSDQEVYDVVFSESHDQSPTEVTLSPEELQKRAEEYNRESARIRELMMKVRPQVYERIIYDVLEYNNE